MPIAAQNRRENVILPPSVDAQVVLGEAFHPETQAYEKSCGPEVARDEVRHDTVQSKTAEHEGNRRLQAFAHQAETFMVLVDRVPEVAGLKREAGNIREIYEAEELALSRREQR